MAKLYEYTLKVEWPGGSDSFVIYATTAEHAFSEWLDDERRHPLAWCDDTFKPYPDEAVLTDIIRGKLLPYEA